ncbi:hypothetical protein GCM10009533_43790 [Saccharopolyspora spinosporotrichia]|uniref:Uncharacterized protein n=1 Tax=Saccharopolyspora erythraea TaxID=1836 RepID=A0ABP3NE57_SACER
MTSDRPILPILPSAWRCRSAPSWSASDVSGVDAVQLEQFETLDAQSPQCLFHLVTQDDRPPVEPPLA